VIPAKNISPESHVVDILGSTKGRDQPVMLVGRALQLATCITKSALLDQNTVFLDPFCKAGEIILATALWSCVVNKGRAKPLASQEEVAQELYGGRYFALAPDQRHFLLTRRTFYGNEKSHDDAFATHIRNGNYLSEIDGRLNEGKFKEELNAMIEFIKRTKPSCRIVAIGNPPYQEADGGHGASAKLIYPHFIEHMIDSNQIDEFVLVIPSRWFSGGKNLGNFRARMMESNQIRTIHYFEKSEEVFPAVQIKGGVCFLQWSKSYQGKPSFVYGDSTITIKLERFDVIPDDPKSPSIILKILDNSGSFVSDIAWSGKPFGLRTFHFKRNSGADQNSENAILCYTTGRVVKYIDRDLITKNADKIDNYKVVAPRAYGKGMKRCTLPKDQIFILGKGEISTETYNVIGCFSTKAEAERFKSYLQTDFARYVLGLRKLTQDIPKDRWNWVPLMDASKTWTDADLFDFFGLTKTEREHIRKKVQEWS